ncbi:MAG TPA: LysM peptidoglycan-binding domain-containing protein [Chthoniobacterales bacterium]|nr:LysM peptidoglycan-binding domain-containing protein [Chthoniobacterales bacterium]
MPNLFKLKRKKLRATAVRRPLRIGTATADYDDLAEPSMKLSRALLIVLLLHIVAVAGIIAFNAIKTHQSALPSSPAATSVAVAPPEPKSQPATTTSTAPAKSSPKSQPKVADSGKTYVVAKGDNPVNIAKKFKVPYDDLVALNHIDDPRKLKIGQKLSIPAKSTKKSD